MTEQGIVLHTLFICMTHFMFMKEVKAKSLNIVYCFKWYHSPSVYQYIYWFICICCCSVAKLCLTLCDPWKAAHQAPLSSNSESLLKYMSIESIMLSNYFILCHPLLLLPSIFLSIRVFSNESALHWFTYR